MPIPRRFALDDLVIRPGTYFNPQTEVLIVVDDSTDVDSEIFDSGDSDETEWVLIADDVPVDETVRDDLIDRFQTRHHPGVSGAIAADEDDVDELDDIKPDVDEDDFVEEEEDDEDEAVEEL